MPIESIQIITLLLAVVTAMVVPLLGFFVRSLLAQQSLAIKNDIEESRAQLKQQLNDQRDTLAAEIAAQRDSLRETLFQHAIADAKEVGRVDARVAVLESAKGNHDEEIGRLRARLHDLIQKIHPDMLRGMIPPPTPSE